MPDHLKQPLYIILHINIKKAKVLKANTTSQEPVKIEDKIIEEIDLFTYLGSVVDSSGGTHRGRNQTKSSGRLYSGTLKEKGCVGGQRSP